MTEKVDEFSLDYIAGTLDMYARGGYDLTLPDSIDKSPRADYEIRASLGDNETLAGLLDEFLQQSGITYSINQKSNIRVAIRYKDSIEDLYKLLYGHSIELARDLAFMTTYEFTQEELVADAESAVRCVKTIEEIHPDRRSSDQVQLSARDVARQLGVSLGDVDPYPRPDIPIPQHLSPAYLAGVFDAKGRYDIKITKAVECNIGYMIQPAIEIHKSPLHPVTVSLLFDSLDHFRLEYLENYEDRIYNFNPTFSGINSMQNFEDIIEDHVLISVPKLTAFRDEIYPRFENDEYKTRQGFYDILYLAEHELDLFRRGRKYDTEYFAREWGDAINTYDIAPE